MDQAGKLTRAFTVIRTIQIATFIAIFSYLIGACRRQGPWWDDGYYPMQFNEQLSNLRVGLWRREIPFGDGYGLGGFTILNIASKIFRLDFTLNARADFTGLLERRYVLVVLTMVGAVVLERLSLRLGMSQFEAIIASILLVLTPNWIGQGTINVKDVPVAVGLLLIANSSIRLLESPIPEVRFGGISFLFEFVLGVMLSFGTRFGLFPFILVVNCCVVGILVWKRKVDKSWTNLIFLIFGNVISYILLVPFNPTLWDPFRMMQRSVTGSLSLFNQSAGPVLTAGRLIDGMNPPWWYLPSWTIAQFPASYVCFLLVGLFTAIAKLSQKQEHRNFRDAFNFQRYPNFPKWAIFCSLTVMPYIAAVILRPPLYDGDRQFIMAYPLLILIIVKTTSSFIKAINLRPLMISIFVLILVISPGVALWQSYPFPYAFRNELILHPERDWEGDYMGVSLREGASRISASNPLSYDFSDERWLASENIDVVGSNIRIPTEGPMFIGTRRGARISLPRECINVDAVTIRPWWREVVLSFVASCREIDLRDE